MAKMCGDCRYAKLIEETDGLKIFCTRPRIKAKEGFIQTTTLFSPYKKLSATACLQFEGKVKN